MAAAVMIWIVLRSQSKQEDRFDRLLDRITHGDGNGAPSLAKILDNQALADQRLTAVEGEVKDLRREHDARVGVCKPLRRAAGGGDA